MNTPTAAPQAGTTPAAQAAHAPASAEQTNYAQAIAEERWYHLRTGVAAGVAIGILVAAWTFLGYLIDPRPWAAMQLLPQISLALGSLILGTLGGGSWAYHAKKNEHPGVGIFLVTLGILAALVVATLWCPSPFAGIAAAAALFFMGWAASKF